MEDAGGAFKGSGPMGGPSGHAELKMLEGHSVGMGQWVNQVDMLNRRCLEGHPVGLGQWVGQEDMLNQRSWRSIQRTVRMEDHIPQASTQGMCCQGREKTQKLESGCGNEGVSLRVMKRTRKVK